MIQEDFVMFTLFVTVLCAAIGFFGWVAEKLENRRPPLPRPADRAVVGESHKPWM